MSEIRKELQHIVFGEFRVDFDQRALFRGRKRIHLPKKPFAVLAYLIEHRGQLVTRETLLEQFWNGSNAYDEAVYRCISSIRKALDDTGEQARYLETRWREGYRFIASVETAESSELSTDAGAESDGAAAEPSPVSAPPAAAAARTPWPWLAIAALAMTVGALVWWQVRPPTVETGTARIDSIAVLPVQGRGVADWQLEGLSEELIHVTSNIEGVRIISALSAAETDPLALARRTGASALLQTRLAGSEDARQLQVQLISGTDGTVLWSFREGYAPADGPASATGAIASLANRLSARLKAPRAAQPKQSSVYLKYLRARQEWRLRTPQSIASAISLYRDIIAEEPDFADAHAGLAEAHVVASLYTGARPSEAFATAREAATRAIELDPANARAHAALAAYYSQYEYDWPRAEQLFARALEIDPNNPLAHQWKADAYCYRLLFEECRYHLGEAKKLDPLSPHLDLFQGIPDRFSRDFAEAERKFRSTLARFPDLALARFQLGLVLDAQGRHAEAIEQWERIYPQYGPALLGSSLAHAYLETGEPERTRALHEELQRMRQDGYLSAVMMAGVAVAQGDNATALDWLEVAYEERDDFFTSIAVIHHFFGLLDQPRFVALTGKLGITPERLRAFAAGADP